MEATPDARDGPLQSVALQQHLNLRCQRNHAKGKCEAGEAAPTARCTEAFAKRVIDSLTECEVWSQVIQELSNGDVALPAEVDEGEELVDVEVSEEERMAIEAKLKHIHCATGHGSMESLRQALKAKGVHAKILKVAQTWNSPTCIVEEKGPPPTVHHGRDPEEG